MNKIDVVRYLDVSGEMRTISYREVDTDELSHDFVINQAMQNNALWRHIQAHVPVYKARNDKSWRSNDWSGVATTPVKAVYNAVPWHALTYWGDALEIEVLDAEIWDQVLYMRKQEEAEIAKHKAAQAKAEAERREKDRREREKFERLMDLGWTLARRTKGTFVRRQDNGEPVAHEPETEGYLVVSRKTGKPLHFGVSDGWRITHIPSGQYLAFADTLKDACAIVGAIHAMTPDVWGEKYPLNHLSREKQNEVQRFLMEYRSR